MRWRFHLRLPIRSRVHLPRIVVRQDVTHKGTLESRWRSVLLNEPCVYCNAPATGCDHIFPRSLGGGDGWLNRAPACESCDNDKGAIPLLVFLVTRQKAARKAARRSYATDAQRRYAERAMQRSSAGKFYSGNIRVPQYLLQTANEVCSVELAVAE